MNNEKVKNIAISVLEKTNIPKNKETYTFDPITILIIISVILTCIRILQECNKNKLSKSCTLNDKCSLYGEQIKEYSIKRGWFTKMRLKKILRREMKKEDYEKYSLSIIQSLFSTGESLKEDDIKTLVEAANV